VFAGAAMPQSPGAAGGMRRRSRQVHWLSRRADPGGLRRRREARHHSSGCVVTWNTLASDCGGGTVVLNYVFSETDRHHTVHWC
jgi:hypothetical protein